MRREPAGSVQEGLAVSGFGPRDFLERGLARREPARDGLEPKGSAKTGSTPFNESEMKGEREDQRMPHRFTAGVWLVDPDQRDVEESDQ